MSKARKIASCLERADSCVRDARLLLAAESRNAAYLPSQAAEHIVTAVANSEDIHIERKDAHQLDTIVRKLTPDNPDREALASISFLEAYATSYRYAKPTGRVPASPPIDRVTAALDRIEAVVVILRRHYGIASSEGGAASNTAPRRR